MTTLTTAMYLNCGILGLLGLLISCLMQMKSQKDKAKLANLQFSASGFFTDEWISILLSAVVIIVGLMLLPTLFSWKPNIMVFAKPAFVPIGYMGTDIILKVFGVVNKRLNAAIDYKTTIADTATGTLAAPTPATTSTQPTPPAGHQP